MVTNTLPTSELLPFEELRLLPVNEQIGASKRVLMRMRTPWTNFIDASRSDYKYWDKVRRGTQTGLELSGLFIKPLCSKICAWVLGRSPQWQTSKDRASQELNHWWRLNQPSIMRAYEEALNLGDCYLVFNGDATLTVVSPNFVEPIYDETDLETRIGWRITIDYSSEATSKVQEVIDEYRADYRRHIVKTEAGKELVTIYPNPLGIVPVIQVSNVFGADERYGRPEGEPLLNALIRYGDVFDAALKGNIRQGRPTPVIEDMGTASQVDEFWERYGTTERVVRPDGTSEDVLVINFDPDMLLTLGGTAKFRYAAPTSFTSDTQNLLELLFYLILQFSEIPEFVWGNAIGSSKASAESQLEPFLKFIDKKRGTAMAWIQQLAEVVVTYYGLFNRQMRADGVSAMWKPMASSDGRLTLDTVIWAWSKHLIDNEMATWLLPINVNDPVMIRKRAEDEWGDDYALAQSVSTPTPASGGGQQGQFNKQETPIQPTERQMKEADDIILTEIVKMLRRDQNSSLYEPDAEPLQHTNGKRHEPIVA